MKSFSIKEYILKFIDANSKGVDIDSILDYLDYINKVRYKEEEIKAILTELLVEKKVDFINNLWFKYS